MSRTAQGKLSRRALLTRVAAITAGLMLLPALCGGSPTVPSQLTGLLKRVTARFGQRDAGAGPSLAMRTGAGR